ncbi:MAG TPA: NAD(P)/FAD-dependent oxidoreductase [Chitinophagaceae bacterium]|jgi:flavin-dependent dehydrogenase|nr:NAD(P)/FAD-dependent oxidoreductase [Chitinophagaceae bacterium]
MSTEPRHPVTLPASCDVLIIGGGLAGLSLSVQLAHAGFSVVLAEKEHYPFHKVCGEYISYESWPFLQSLGVPLEQWGLPLIRRLLLTAPDGGRFTTQLPLGGFGVSRHRLDSTLAGLARAAGVQLLEGVKAEAVQAGESGYAVRLRHAGGVQDVQARVCAGSFGKRSNLDVQWKRPFALPARSKGSNFVAVKYHVRVPWPEDVIGLHNFAGGYCGISRIEEGLCCLCYLTTAGSLQAAGNSVPRLEKNALRANPHLDRIFREAETVPSFPLTISQVSFRKKSLVEQGVLLLGDAAGMITPLCGNGMSMALHGSKILGRLIPELLEERMSRPELEAAYTRQWKKAFGSRLLAGRWLQPFFGHNTLSNLFVRSFRALPALAGPVIRLTHGRDF